MSLLSRNLNVSNFNYSIFERFARITIKNYDQLTTIRRTRVVEKPLLNVQYTNDHGPLTRPGTHQTKLVSSPESLFAVPTFFWLINPLINPDM